jgi:hypothetical protein
MDEAISGKTPARVDVRPILGQIDAKRPYPGMANEIDALLPARTFFPTWLPRRVADTCRRDKRLRAVRVGKAWMLRRSDYERWIAGLQGADACVPSVDDAAADLRRRGVI